MTNCRESRVKLTTTQLNKLNSAAKDLIKKTLKMKNCHVDYF